MRIKGIIHFTGEHDTGKTLAALGVCHPRDTFFIHDDVKPPGIAPDDFGQHIDLVEVIRTKKLTLLQTREYFLEFLLKIKPGQYQGIVIDTWSRIGTALQIWGKHNATQFREPTTMAPQKAYQFREGQEWREAHLYEASVISHLSSLAPYIGLVTHLKNHYLNEKPTGKEIPDAGKSFDRICSARFWLRNNPNSGVPIALVLKRINTVKVGKDGIEVINLLPRKITPLPEEKSIWDAIDRYKANPYGNREPLPEEEPTEFELSILDGTLTNDQREVWRSGLVAQEAEEERGRKALEAEIILKAQNGKNSHELYQEYSEVFSLPEIIRMIQ